MDRCIGRPRRMAFAFRTSTEWLDYFYRNRRRPRAIPWQEGIVLGTAERAAVIRSIQVFQLGESGSGRHFLRAAKRYALRAGDADYPAAAAMFLGEEHRHARELGRVLDLAGEPRLDNEWTDGAFRWLRHRAGLELLIVVLLTGEVMAQVYYAALRRATLSNVLRRLCRQILIDEAAHVRFQSERLALLRRERSGVRLALARLGERVLFAAACVVVWRGHRSVFRRAGLSFRSFFRRAFTAFDRSCCWRNPRHYIDLSPATRMAVSTETTMPDASPPHLQDVYS